MGEFESAKEILKRKADTYEKMAETIREKTKEAEEKKKK